MEIPSRERGCEKWPYCQNRIRKTLDRFRKGEATGVTLFGTRRKIKAELIKAMGH